MTMRFASAFDERLFLLGPAAIFTLDPRGELRVDPERTREIHLLTELSADAPRDPAAWVLTDRATGLRMVLVTTHAAMATLQPRADAVRAPDFATALALARGGAPTG
jgi:hypothetical protein